MRRVWEWVKLAVLILMVAAFFVGMLAIALSFLVAWS